jgi:glycosyltransferase involved in cell wall biosynthesis
MPVKPRSLLFVTPRWTRDGGVATHAIASATALAEQGIEVHVVAARIDDGEPAAGVTLHHAPALYDYASPPAVRLGDALAPSPSVVHLHQFDDPTVLAFLREHAPVVSSVHGYVACTSGVHYFGPGEQCTRAHGPGCVPNLLLRGCAHTLDPRPLPAAYRRATNAVQALAAADLAISYSSAVDRHLAVNDIARRVVIPLFTTMQPVSGSGHAERRRVVFAGRVVAPKGVNVLIRAARDVDGEFVICGDGWKLAAMRRLAERLGVSERVHFRGWVGAEQLARELAEASIVAVPSLWPEPFGLAGIEAFAAGRPVVASATGGIGDWLHDGVNGLSVEPGDAGALARALNDLLADPDRQATMGRAGRRTVAERFTREHHVAALIEAYGRARATWESKRTAGAAPAISAAR